jgi:hypothetical protein
MYNDAENWLWLSWYVGTWFYYGNSAVMTSVGASPPRLATGLVGYPNPFRPATTLAFELVEPTRVGLRVYDVSGRSIRTLRRGDLAEPGRHEVIWDGRDDSGRRVAAGVYFVRLQAGPRGETRRLVRLR